MASTKLSSENPAFSGRWVSQVECAYCDFTGCEDEFLALSIEEGEAVFSHRDGAPSPHVLVCTGCVATLGRFNAAAVAVVLHGLIERRGR